MSALLLLCCITLSSGYFLKVLPGSMCVALGNVITVVDEGFAAYHNPALTDRTECAFSVSRYFYATNMIAFSSTYRNNAVGLRYLNYGSIQGYDEEGFETGKFTPYSMDMLLARKLGPCALHIKGFIETIDSYRYAGICGGISAFYRVQAISLGFKVDNIGKISNEDTDIPMIIALGSCITLPSNFNVFLETKGLPLEYSGGISYQYKTITILFGTRFLAPYRYSGPELTTTTGDIHLSGGIKIAIENYTIGYAFVNSEYSGAHHFTISLAP